MLTPRPPVRPTVLFCGTIHYVRAIISRADRGTWPYHVLREAEYKALLDEITEGSTSWMITGLGARRRPWRWSPTQGFLWESTDPPDPEIISQLASLHSATLVVRFPDMSALQVDLRTRRWTALAPHTGSTAHDRAVRVHQRLRRFDQWWRNVGLAFAASAMLGIIPPATVILVDIPLILLPIVLISISCAQLLMSAHDGLKIRDRFLPKRAPTFTVGPINVTAVLGAVLLVVVTVLITNWLGNK